LDTLSIPRYLSTDYNYTTRYRIVVYGFFAGNANNKTVGIKTSDGTVLVSNTTTTAPNGKKFRMEVELMTITTSNYQSFGRMFIEPNIMENAKWANPATTDGSLTIYIYSTTTAASDVQIFYIALEAI